MLKDKIRDFIIQSAYTENQKIENNTLIFKEGLMDSMGFVMLITFLSDSFNISITDNELVEENFESIDAISDFISRKSNN